MFLAPGWAAMVRRVLLPLSLALTLGVRAMDTSITTLSEFHLRVILTTTV